MKTSVNLSDEVLQELREYLGKKYGSKHRMTSVIIQRAITEWLEREKAKDIIGGEEWKKRRQRR